MNLLSPGLKFETITITPQMAVDLLRGNHGNRNVRHKVVEKYAGIMRDGKWQLSPHGVVIANTGRILDGQHRLMAVVQSGRAVDMSVITGADEAMFSILDRGVTRSVSDALRLDKRSAEVVGFTLRVLGLNAVRTTDHRIEAAWLAMKSDIMELQDYCNSAVRTFSAVPFRTAAILRIAEGTHAAYAKETYRNLVHGKVHELSPAPAALFSAIARGTVSTASRNDLLMRAWRSFDEGRKDGAKIAIKNPDVVMSEIRETIRKKLGPQVMAILNN